MREVIEPDTTVPANQLVVPFGRTNALWQDYHRSAGHASPEKVLSILRRRFFWVCMGKAVHAWTTECPTCVVSKAGPEQRAPLKSIESSYPFEVVGLDYLSLGRPGDVYPYILVMTDLFSRYAFAVPTKDQTAATTVKALCAHLIRDFGCPERILTDQGAAFESQLLKQLCEMYGCVKSRTTPYHPQGNGACERLNQTLISLLSSLEPEAQHQWHHQLPYLVQAYNNLVHASTGMTPHFVVYSRHARLPVDLLHDVSPPQQRTTLEGLVRYHHRILLEAYERVKTHAARRQLWDQRRYDQRARATPLLPGERVLVRNFRRRAAGKLAPKWMPRPHVVLGQLRPGEPVYLVRPEGLDGPGRTLHRNNLRPYPAGVPLGGEESSEEVQREAASLPSVPRLPFLPQEDHGANQRSGPDQAPPGGDYGSAPLVPTAMGRREENPELDGQSSRRLGTDELQLEAPVRLPAQGEAGPATRARPDSVDPEREESGPEAASPSEHSTPQTLRRSRRCNQGKPPLHLIQL